MRIQSLLVPVDFSPCSGVAARRAAHLALQLDARLLLLHVCEVPAGMDHTTRVSLDGRARAAAQLLEAEAREHLDKLADETRGMGVKVATHVVFGNVTAAILDAVKRLEADLLLMGTQGRTGLQRLVLGSVAEGVSRQAPVPVMLVRWDGDPACEGLSDEEARSRAAQQLEAERQG